MKSLFKAVALISVFSVLSRVFGFFFKIYLSRAITPEELGIYQVSLSIFIVLLNVASSGMQLVVSKQSTKYQSRNDKNGEFSMMSSAAILSLISSVVLCLLVIVFKDTLRFFFADDRCIRILFILLPALIFQSVYSVFRGSLWGKNSYFKVCISEFFEQIIRILSCILLLSIPFNFFNTSESVALSLTVSCLFSLILVFIFYFSSGGRLKKPSKVYKEIFLSNLSLTGVRVVSSLAQPVIAIILPIRMVAAGYTNSQAISLFGVAMGMTMPLLFIPITLVGSLSMALIPDISKALCENDNKHINNRISSSIIFTILISFILIPIYIGAGENIGIFLFNNAQSGSLLSSSAWLMIPFSLVNITSSILNALGCENKSLINYCVGAVFLILSIIFLPKYIGIKSLIVGMGLCVSIASLLNIRMIKKKTNVDLNILKPMVKMGLFCLPSSAITFFITGILNHFLPLFFNLVISCSIGALSFILLCVIFKIININTWFIEAKKLLTVKKKKKLA